MNNNIRIAETQCSLGTWFVSGIYVKIPYIKEISMMMMIMIIIIISERSSQSSSLSFAFAFSVG
jgi:hypothetical protein